MVSLERLGSCTSCYGVHHRCYIRAISAVFQDSALLTSFHFYKAFVIQLFDNVSQQFLVVRGSREEEHTNLRM
jgi:hypothetical protein